MGTVAIESTNEYYENTLICVSFLILLINMCMGRMDVAKVGMQFFGTVLPGTLPNMYVPTTKDDHSKEVHAHQ